MQNTTEQAYINMANDCKEIVDKKDRYIEHLKDRMSDSEDRLRLLEYSISNLLYLTNYKSKTIPKEHQFFITIDHTLACMKEAVDFCRENLQDEDEDDIINIIEIIEQDE
tara:strand:+ start:1898 stop:2227 length:330 start_codon:yes stop_codon:yes gene_type:complete